MSYNQIAMDLERLDRRFLDMSGIILLLSLHPADATVTMSRYKQAGPGYKLQATDVIATYSHPSVSSCLSRCTSVESCNSVSWNQHTSECLLSDIFIAYIPGDTSPWISYGKMQYNVWHVEGPNGVYSMNREDANSRCAQEGGRVASRDEVQQAYEYGFHACACSWMNDNTQAIVLQYPSPGCGSSSGINACYQNLANAFCTDDIQLVHY